MGFASKANIWHAFPLKGPTWGLHWLWPQWIVDVFHYLLANTSIQTLLPFYSTIGRSHPLILGWSMFNVFVWVVVTQVVTHVKIHQAVHLRFVKFILCKLYLKERYFKKKKVEWPLSIYNQGIWLSLDN